MNRSKYAIICAGITAGAALSVSIARADSAQNDLYFQEANQRYFEYPQNARTFAMEGSSVFTSHDSSSVVGNPAGLGMMQIGELSGTYSHNQISGREFPTDNDVDQNSNIGSGMIALPLGEETGTTPDYGTVGLAWDQTWSGWHRDSFDSLARERQIVGSYGYALSNDLSLGYSFGWTQDRLQARDLFDYPMSSGMRHTVGAQFKVDENVALGATAFIGHGYHHALFEPGNNTSSDTFEVGAGIGSEIKLGDTTTLSLAADYQNLRTRGDVEQSIPANIIGGNENGNVFDFRAGVEQKIGENFLARAGYRFAGLGSYSYGRSELQDLSGSAYYNAFSVGAGVVIPTDWHYVPEVRVDYGVEYRAVGFDDWQHVVTISVPFDVCPPEVAHNPATKS